MVSTTHRTVQYLPFLRLYMSVSNCVQINLEGTVLVDIEVQPSSTRQGVIGMNEWRNRIQVAVKAEAQRGKANFAVCNVLKTVLGTDVEIVKGLTSRQKKIKITGISSDVVISKLEGLVESRKTV